MSNPAVVEFAIPVEVVERYSEWQECAAFRFVRDGDEVRLQFVDSLEEITAPEGSDES